MAKLTEAEARRVCKALGRDPDAIVHEPADQWPGHPTDVGLFGDRLWARVSAWRIAQRAAEESPNG